MSEKNPKSPVLPKLNPAKSPAVPSLGLPKKIKSAEKTDKTAVTEETAAVNAKSGDVSEDQMKDMARINDTSPTQQPEFEDDGNNTQTMKAPDAGELDAAINASLEKKETGTPKTSDNEQKTSTRTFGKNEKPKPNNVKSPVAQPRIVLPPPLSQQQGKQPSPRPDSLPEKMPGAAVTPLPKSEKKKSNDRNELPEEWLEGKSVNNVKKTFFASPNLIPSETSEDGFVKDSMDSHNVDLEKNENLPTELEDVIAGYDDEIRHVRTRDGARECTIQLAIARILEYTGYEKLAYVRYLKALEANHYSRTAIHELRRIARAYNKTKDVTTLLQSEIDTDISAEEQALLLEECALIIYFSDESKHSEAINILYRAIALAPQNVSPICTLIYLLMFEKRYQECVDVISKLVPLIEDRDIQASLQCIKGDLESGERPFDAYGLNSYLQALELSPGALYAYQHAMCILFRREEWQSLYARSIAFSKASKDKVICHAVLMLAGVIAMDLLSDSVGSNAAFEQALKLVPNDTAPLELLVDNYIDDPSRWRELDSILKRLLDATDVPKKRLELTLLRAINFNVSGKSPDKALEILGEIIRETPQERIILEYYFELLHQEGHVDEAMRISKHFAELASADDAAARFAKLGCYCYDVLKKYDEAEFNFRNALLYNPDQRVAFDYLEQILRARNDYDGLIKIYRDRLNVVMDAKLRASILYTLATICDYSLGQLDNAISYYRQYREIYPDDIHVIHNLERLAQRTNDWRTQIEMLLVEKDVASTSTERCDLLMRVANICRYKLNKLQYAAAFLKQAKGENPKCQNVYHELIDVLKETKNWKELIVVQTELLAIQKKPAEKVLTLISMAGIQEDNLCDTNAAIACYEQILKIEPDNLLASVKLSHLYRRTGNLAGYYELALDKAQRLSLPQQKSRQLFRVALKTLTLFHEPEQAISILEMAQACDPAYTPATYVLTIIYGATCIKSESRIVALVRIIQDYTNSSKNQSTRSACAQTLAYLNTWTLHRLEDAIHPLELSLALSPDALNARFMLIQVQKMRQQYAELAPLIAEGAQNARDKNLAAHDYNLAAFIAHTYPSTPGAFESEVSSLKAAIEIDPDNIIANERLEAMEPCRTNLVPFIEKRLKNAAIEDKVELQIAIAESIFPDLPQKSFTMICDVVEENPTHLPALRIAANMAQKLNNPKLLCRFLVLQAQNLENIAMRITAWTNAAQIARDQLGQPDLAADYFKQAFLLAPQRMDLCDQLLVLLKAKHDLAAIDSIMQIHARSISKENQVMRYIQMADDYANEFNDPAQAIIKLRQVLEIEHNNVDVLWKLSQLDTSLQHWSDARSSLEAILDIQPDNPELMLQTRRALVDLYINQLGVPKLAIPILQDILSQNAEDVQAIDNMAQIYMGESRFNEALALLLRLNKLLTPPNNMKVLLQIANIYKTIDDTDKLTQIMSEAASLVELQPTVLYELQPWISRCNDTGVLRAFIEKLLDLKNLPNDVQVDIYAFIAFCYAGPLHMRFEADKYAVAAANLDPMSLKTQLIAAQVFDPKEAMVHACAAAAISPFSVEPYQAMLNIAVNSNRFDLQARVEQQIALFSESAVQTDSLQKTFRERYPHKFGCIDEAFIWAAQTVDFNRNICDLLKLAGLKTQLFEWPARTLEPISRVRSIANVFAKVARAFGVDSSGASIVRDAPFVFSQSPDSPDELIFNVTALEDASEAEIRFHMATALMHIKLCTLPLVTLPPDNIAMLVSGLLGLYDDKMTVPNILNRVKALVPRNVRKSIVELISSRGINAFQYDPKQLQFSAAALDANIGHLFSADLEASLFALIRRKAPNGPMPVTAQQRLVQYSSTPYIPELLAFNTSEHYSELRQRAGVFIKMNG